MRDVFSDYCEGRTDLLRFFAAPPAQLAAHADGTAEWDPALVAAINAYQGEIGGTATLTGNELAVVTGQQPALFTGPLYTVYKAITAIKAAEKIERVTGRPCKPIFWVAGDDHDFDEARSAVFLEKEYKPLTLSYAPSSPIAGLPMYRVPIEDSLHAMVDTAASRTRGSEYREPVRCFLHESLDTSVSLADWTARLLARLFAGTPLVIFAPHLPRARALAATVIRGEIEAPLVSSRLVNEAGAALRALDYPQQIQKNANECGFFVEMDGCRRKVIHEDGAFRLPEERRAFSRQDLFGLLDREPERFSANVAVRCIVQQRLFPTVAYVAGPGEVAYWAQLGPLFEHYGVPMPIVYPRARCVLTTAKLKRQLEAFELDLSRLYEGADDLILDVVPRRTGSPAQTELHERRKEIEARLRDLAAALGEHDGSAHAMAEKLARKVEKDLDKIQWTLAYQMENRGIMLRDQVERLCDALAPWRKPQERVYTVFSFLFEHGWPLMERLIASLDIESFELNEVEL